MVCISQVHDGSSAPDPLIAASTKLDRLLSEYFELHKKDFEHADMGGGSDYLPFLDEGIPAGGLMTGASRKKSMEQRKRFGGFANAQLDPCYHQRYVFVKCLSLCKRNHLHRYSWYPFHMLAAIH